MTQKYFIKTYGCQMNVADSGRLAAILESAGYLKAQSEKKADVILVNTCVVRKNAEDKAAWYIQSLKGNKKKNPELVIGVCGCIVTEPGRSIAKDFPHVDLFIPPGQPEKLKEFLLPLTPNPFPLNKGEGAGEGGLVTIMTGCDNFCSYCIVPYVRGREYSRPMPEVLSEIKEKLEQGATDITLLGQNVNSYKYGLANLLKGIGKIVDSRKSTVESRLSFLTSHPRDMSDEIIEAVHALPYVAKEFMLPLQSGDDEILKKMNRGYDMAHYLGRIKKIRSLMPDASLITDIMVGFPGETEEQFENTLKAIENIKFKDIHMFAYSSRPETSASKLPNQLGKDLIYKRLQRLIEAVHKQMKQLDSISPE